MTLSHVQNLRSCQLASRLLLGELLQAFFRFEQRPLCGFKQLPRSVVSNNFSLKPDSHSRLYCVGSLRLRPWGGFFFGITLLTKLAEGLGRKAVGLRKISRAVETPVPAVYPIPIPTAEFLKSRNDKCCRAECKTNIEQKMLKQLELMVVDAVF